MSPGTIHFRYFFGAVRLVVLGMLLFSAGCTTTRFTQETPCIISLHDGSRLLVPWLPTRNPEFYLEGLRNVYDDRNIRVASADEEEWTLKTSGIINPLDTTSYPALCKLGYTHVLLITELSSRPESKYAYFTAKEVSYENVMNAYKPTWEERGNQSEVLLQLVSLQADGGTQKVAARTTIGHLVVKENNGGETYLNPTSIESARYKAMSKAARHLLRNCRAR